MSTRRPLIGGLKGNPGVTDPVPLLKRLTGLSGGLSGGEHFVYLLFGSGPAAVAGDKSPPEPLSALNGWEGRASRTIRKPEDLPGEKRYASKGALYGIGAPPVSGQKAPGPLSGIKRGSGWPDTHIGHITPRSLGERGIFMKCTQSSTHQRGPSLEPPAPSYRFFENRSCEFFPCHKTREGDLNCLFCYCPLYNRECPGEPVMRVINGHEVKDCTNCRFPHQPDNYQDIIRCLMERIS